MTRYPAKLCAALRWRGENVRKRIYRALCRCEREALRFDRERADRLQDLAQAVRGVTASRNGRPLPH